MICRCAVRAAHRSRERSSLASPARADAGASGHEDILARASHPLQACRDAGSTKLADASEIERAHVGVEAFRILAAERQQAEYRRLAERHEGERADVLGGIAEPGIKWVSLRGPALRRAHHRPLLALLGIDRCGFLEVRGYRLAPH